MTEYVGKQRWVRLDTPGESDRTGGTAHVFQATNESGVIVAIKEARQGKGRWIDAERRLLQQIARDVPDAAEWLVAVLDHGETADGTPWMALPWYDLNLLRWAWYEHPPMEDRLDALVLSAGAVLKLHGASPSPTRRYLHRDIKPENLLVDPGPPLRVLLADLGGAMEGRVSVREGFPGAWTPDSAPLEQSLGLDRLELSVDVHGLASTIYHTLVGRSPWAEGARDALLNERGRELRSLHKKSNRRPANEARYHELRALRLEEFLVRTDEPALPEAARTELIAQVSADLAGRVEEPDEVATRACGPLLDVLERSLALLPQHRNQDPRVLADACEQAREIIEAEVRQDPRSRPRSITLIAGQPAAPAAETVRLPTPRRAPAPVVVTPAETVQATPEPPPPPPPKGMNRGLAVALTIEAALVLIIAWLVVRSVGSDPEETPTAPVVNAAPAEAPPPGPEATPAQPPTPPPAGAVPPAAAPRTGATATTQPAVSASPASPALSASPPPPEAAPAVAGVTLVWACSGDLDAVFARDGGPGASRPLRGTFGPGTHRVDMTCAGDQRSFVTTITGDAGGVRVAVTGGSNPLATVVPDGEELRICYRTDAGALAWGKC